MAKYVRKITEVEVVQWNGGIESLCEIEDFLGDGPQKSVPPAGKDELLLETISGDAIVKIGDWIIKEQKSIEHAYPNGDFYKCKNSVFRKTYKEVK